MDGGKKMSVVIVAVGVVERENVSIRIGGNGTSGDVGVLGEQVGGGGGQVEQEEEEEEGREEWGGAWGSGGGIVERRRGGLCGAHGEGGLLLGGLRCIIRGLNAVYPPNNRSFLKRTTYIIILTFFTIHSSTFLFFILY